MSYIGLIHLYKFVHMESVDIINAQQVHYWRPRCLVIVIFSRRNMSCILSSFNAFTNFYPVFPFYKSWTCDSTSFYLDTVRQNTEWVDLKWSSTASEIKDNFEQFPFCFSSPGALELDILARSSSRLEFQFSIMFFTIRTAVLIFLFSV